GHIEQQFARLNGEVETLHHQDGTLAERVQIYTEMLKRLEAQISVVSSEVAVKQDVLERIELARVEIHRLEERTSVLETLAAELRETDDDGTERLNRIHGPDRRFADR